MSKLKKQTLFHVVLISLWLGKDSKTPFQTSHDSVFTCNTDPVRRSLIRQIFCQWVHFGCVIVSDNIFVKFSTQMFVIWKCKLYIFCENNPETYHVWTFIVSPKKIYWKTNSDHKSLIIRKILLLEGGKDRIVL